MEYVCIAFCSADPVGPFDVSRTGDLRAIRRLFCDDFGVDFRKAFNVVEKVCGIFDGSVAISSDGAVLPCVIHDSEGPFCVESLAFCARSPAEELVFVGESRVCDECIDKFHVDISFKECEEFLLVWCGIAAELRGE